MGYCDATDAEMIALTRQRRAEACARRLVARAAHETLEFPVVPRSVQDQIEAAWRGYHRPAMAPHIAWKNQQWEAGIRRCGYCAVRMTRTPNVPRTCTVDHRKPRAYGGRDAPDNWLMACLDCNSQKGDRSEAAFRARMKWAA